MWLARVQIALAAAACCRLQGGMESRALPPVGGAPSPPRLKAPPQVEQPPINNEPPDEEFAAISNDISKQAALDTSAVSEAKQQRKKAPKNPRLSDQSKIESIYEEVDELQLASNLTGNVAQYLTTLIDKASNSKVTPSDLKLALNALQYSQSVTNHSLQAIGKAANNTKAKSSSAQAHAVLTQTDRARQKDERIRAEALTRDDPKKRLEMQFKQTKSEVDAIRSTSQNATQPAEDMSQPRQKRQKPGETGEAEVDNVAAYRFPRSSTGQRMYNPQEAADVGYNISIDPNLTRSEKSKIRTE